MVKPLLLKRIRNDLNEAVEDLGLDPIDFSDDCSFPLSFDIRIEDIPGYSSPDKMVNEHRFTLYLSQEYPYERPTVKWNSEIFHPNIMAPSEGGMVCVRALDIWNFDSGLKSFISAITDLIKNPNPYDPLGSPTCEAAAEWFLNNR